LDYISDEEIDLVIMGTHGRKGLDRVFFGSVADRVVKMSPVPVLTINPYKTPVAV
jgi:nucleotide-binding universal stress UspA family protein